MVAQSDHNSAKGTLTCSQTSEHPDVMIALLENILCILYRMTTKCKRNNSILEALFTSHSRVEIVKLFFLRPTDCHYLREIETLTDQSVRAVQRELAAIDSAKILLSESDGNRRYFHANRNTPVFSELRPLIIQTTCFSDIIRE